MDRSKVPKFGNWENDGDVPYTDYFDKARKKRGGKMINPNDPQQNLDMFPKNHPSSLTRASSDPPPQKPTLKPDEPRIGPGPEHQFSSLPARRMLHPYYQAKAWEGKSHESTHGTSSGGSRLKPTKGDESPDSVAAVPRFGEWDENDPKTAEEFTHIFNQVREERNAEAGNVSATPKNPSYGRQQTKESKKSGCFCW